MKKIYIIGLIRISWKLDTTIFKLTQFSSPTSSPPPPPKQPFSFGSAKGLLDLEATQRKVVISFLLSLPFPGLGRM